MISSHCSVYLFLLHVLYSSFSFMWASCPHLPLLLSVMVVVRQQHPLDSRHPCSSSLRPCWALLSCIGSRARTLSISWPSWGVHGCIGMQSSTSLMTYCMVHEDSEFLSVEIGCKKSTALYSPRPSNSWAEYLVCVPCSCLEKKAIGFKTPSLTTESAAPTPLLEASVSRTKVSELHGMHKNTWLHN